MIPQSARLALAEQRAQQLESLLRAQQEHSEVRHIGVLAANAMP